MAERVFSGALNEDIELQFSCRNFDKIIERSVKSINCLNLQEKVDELMKPVFYPSNYVFASLAHRSYVDRSAVGNASNLHGEQVEGDWRLLTVARSEDRVFNGYVGSAYWNPITQQVILAHRGTYNVGGGFTDYKGVILNQHVKQINSAITFTYEVISVLKQINKDRGTNIQLFLTGHSLGAWLAPITAFAAMFLVKEGDSFVASEDFGKTGYHVSTVCFDGPGCRNMLENIQCWLMNRYNVCLIDSLDVVNYLSMPHLVNACNLQVGVVYRIFLKLSENEKEDLQRMNILRYTQFAHSIVKIKEAFDPNTGSVKIKRVIDWPLLISKNEKPAYSEGILWGIKSALQSIPVVGQAMKINDLYSELKEFFKLGNALNDFDVDEKSAYLENSARKIRYRTQTLSEEQKNQQSLNVFTQSECRFLEMYTLLESHKKESPVELKFESVFSCLQGNQELKKKLVSLLENFKVENGVIRSNQLQEFIPFIKRLLNFFPKIKAEAEKAWGTLPIHMLSKFYESVSLSYLKLMEDSLKFENNDTQLNNFLESNSLKVLQIIESDTFLGSTRVYNALSSLETHYDDEKYYIFLSLSRVSSDSLFIKFLTKAKEKYLLVVLECDYRLNDKIEFFLLQFLKILKGKANIKIILVTEKGSRLSEFVQKSYECVGSFCKIQKTELMFNDLTPETQRILLEQRMVVFQGKEVPLSSIVNRKDGDNLNKLFDSETIIGLFRKDRIEISTALPTLKQMEHFYIQRILIQKVKVRDNFLSDELSRDVFAISNIDKDSLSTLTRTQRVRSIEETDHNLINPVRFIVLKGENDENDFEKLSKEFDNYNIHWVKRETNGDFIWQRSKGDLSGIRNYIQDNNRDLSETEYSENNSSVKVVNVDDIRKFKEKFVIIAAEPGMGKTTALTYLGTQASDHSKWIIRINLIQHREKLEKANFSELDVILDLLHEHDNNNTVRRSLAKKLLMHRLDDVGHIVVFLDGFDEVNQKCQANVVQLLHTLKETKVERVLISTRLHLRELLENNLSTFAHIFKPFSTDDQKEFLKKFWREGLDRSMDEEFLDSYIKKVLQFISESLRDKERKLMGIPLQMRMIAEAFQEGLENHSNWTGELTFPETFDMLQLYDRFVDAKYQVYFKKFGQNSDFSQVAKDFIVEKFNAIHMRLAFRILFPEENEDFVGKKFLSEEVLEEMKKVGMIQFFNDTITFIHTTFAEYFAAKFLANRLNKKHRNIQKYDITVEFLKRELFEIKNEIIKAFLDYSLAKNKVLVAALKGDLDFIKCRSNFLVVDALGRSAMHYASQAGHKEIVDILSKKGAHCRADKLGRTPLHYAARYNHHTHVTNYLLERFPECINARDKNDCLAVYYAAQQSTWNIVNRILSEKGALTAGIQFEKMIFCYAYNGKLHNLIGVIVDQKIHNAAFIKDNHGNTLLHVAAQNGHIDVVQYLFEKGAEIEIANNEGKTALICAAENYHWDTVGFLIDANSFSGKFDECDLFKKLDVTLVEVKPNFKDLSNEHKKALLKHAIENSRWNVIHLFISDRNQHIYFDTLDVKQRSELLCSAIYNRQLNIAKFIIERNTDVNNCDKRGRTPIHYASRNEYWNIVELLLRKNASLNELSDKQKFQQFHYSVENESWDIVELFMKDRKRNEYFNKNKENVKDQQRIEFLCYLIRSKDADSSVFLIEKGVKVNDLDKHGKKPIHYAAEKEMWCIVDLLLKKGADSNDLNEKQQLKLSRESAKEH